MWVFFRRPKPSACIIQIFKIVFSDGLPGNRCKGRLKTRLRPLQNRHLRRISALCVYAL